jgi:hypothetical protein
VKAFLSSKAVVALLTFLAIDLIVFRTGLYNVVVKPESFSGRLIRLCELANSYRGEQAIALIGDSRIREGFSAQVFDQLAKKNSLRALNLGLSGSSPRVWYYLLKAVDPNCDSFKVIVIALPSYWDEEYAYGTADRREDLQILLPILGLRDAFEYTQSVYNRAVQTDAILALCLKMYGFRYDLKDLIANPWLRAQECKDSNQYWRQTDYEYSGRSETLSGARVVNNRVVGLPDFLKAWQKERLQLNIVGMLERDPNIQYPYLQHWIEKLTDRYANSSTKLVFIHIPSNPLSVPLNHRVHAMAIEAASRRANVIVDPVDSFVYLEKPEFFFDDVHLNKVGRKIFSERASLALLKYAEEGSPRVAEKNPPL